MQRFIVKLLALFFFIHFTFAAIAENSLLTINAELNEINANIFSNSVEDNNGYIWTATSTGVYRFDGIRTIPVDELFDIPKCMNVKRIGYIEQTSEIILFTQTLGVFVINTKSNQVKIVEIGSARNVIGFKATESMLYVFYRAKIVTFDFNFSKVHQLEFSEHQEARILDVTGDEEAFYVGTTKGLFTFYPSDNSLVKHSIMTKRIDSVDSDSVGLVVNQGCSNFYLLKNDTTKIVKELSRKNPRYCYGVKVALYEDQVLINSPTIGMELWDFGNNTTERFRLSFGAKFNISQINLSDINLSSTGFVLSSDGVGVILLPFEQLLFTSRFELDMLPATSKWYDYSQVDERTGWVASKHGAFLIDERLNILDSVTRREFPQKILSGFHSVEYIKDTNSLWLVPVELEKLYIYDMETKELTVKKIPGLFNLGKTFGTERPYLKLENSTQGVDLDGGFVDWQYHHLEDDSIESLAAFSKGTFALLSKEKLKIAKNSDVVSTIDLTSYINDTNLNFDSLFIINDNELGVLSAEHGFIFFEFDEKYQILSHHVIDPEEYPVASGFFRVEYSVEEQALYAISSKGLYKINTQTFEISPVISKELFWHDSLNRLAFFNESKILLLNSNSLSLVEHRSIDSIRKRDRFTISMVEKNDNNKIILEDFYNGEINLKESETLSKIYLTHMQPMSTTSVQFYYQLDDSQKWRPVSDDHVIYFSDLPAGDNTIKIKGVYNNIDSIEQVYQINHLVPFLETQVFRMMLGSFILLAFSLLGFLYYLQFREKFLANRHLDLLSESFIQISTPHFVMNLKHDFVIKNQAFVSLYPDCKSEVKLTSLVKSTELLNQWEKAFEGAKNKKYWFGNLEFDYTGQNRSFYTSITFLNEYDSYVVSINEFDVNDETAALQANRSHEQFLTLISHMPEHQNFAVIFIRPKSQRIDVSLLNKRLLELSQSHAIKAFKISRLYGFDIGLVLQHNCEKDLFQQVANIENYLLENYANEQFGIGVTVQEGFTSECLMQYTDDSLNDSLSYTLTTTRFNNLDLSHKFASFVAKNMQLVENVLKDNALYVSPIVNTKTGHTDTLEVSIFSEHSNLNRVHQFLPFKLLDKIYTSYFELLTQESSLKAISATMVLPIPLNFILTHERETKSFMHLLQNASQGKVRLLVECQNMYQLREHYELFAEIRSWNLDFWISCNDISKLATDDITHIHPTAIFIDTINLTNVTEHFNAAIDGLISMCISLNIEVGIGGVNNQKTLLLKNKGVSLITGKQIFSPVLFSQYQGVLNTNYLGKIVPERLHLQKSNQ